MMMYSLFSLWYLFLCRLATAVSSHCICQHGWCTQFHSLEVINIVSGHFLRGRARQALSLLLLEELLLSVQIRSAHPLLRGLGILLLGVLTADGQVLERGVAGQVALL